MFKEGTMINGMRKRMMSRTVVAAALAMAEEAVSVTLTSADVTWLASLDLGIYQYRAMPTFSTCIKNVKTKRQ
jgi:type IV secretory pathway protease TraF